MTKVLNYMGEKIQMTSSDDEIEDTIINLGLYDDIYQCCKCGYKYSQSVDATDSENEERKFHNCNQ